MNCTAPMATTPEQNPSNVQNVPSAADPLEAVKDSLILVRGGTFTMGSPDSERQRGEDETAHNVTVSDFYADPCEVTQADYERIMGSNPSHFSGADLPVDSVTWYDAIEYCNRLSESRDPSVVTSSYRGKTIAVDSLSPNQFGLYNMYGNVSEWCFDYYGAYDLTRTVDPAGATSGSLRVNRGGSYIDFAKHLRSAYRSATNPEDPDQNLGFRIARNAQAGEGMVETTFSLDIQMPENPRILVAYFSYSGNTENAARIIRDKTGADLVELEMENPYRGNIYEVSQADLNNHVHPALRTHIADVDEYDVILLGYPTWWATMPMPVVTFMESYDFDGKIVIPFSSHGGTMFGDSVSDLSKMIPGSYVGQGFEFNYSGGSGLSDEISQWLALNGIKER